MWLTSSSIGRKFVMALTGICLVLFVTFHVLMNAVAIIWPAAYNDVCGFLGANWYALIASAGLAALFIIHIIYAVWLTIQNRKARGNDRYEVTSRPPQVEWSSKNMLVLGIVILAFLVLHLCQFWYRMQFQEIMYAHDPAKWTTLGSVVAQPEFGTLFLQAAFSCWWTLVLYLIGFIALWLHMTHGVWSMFHSIGWDNNKWLSRLKCIANVWTSIVCLLFAVEAIVFTVQARNNYYLTNECLQQQYEGFWAEQSDKLLEDFDYNVNTVRATGNMGSINDFITDKLPCYKAQAEFILNGAKKQCPAYESASIRKVECMLNAINQGPCALIGKACDKPCDQACEKACEKACDKACDQACDKACDKACDQACDEPCCNSENQ